MSTLPENCPPCGTPGVRSDRAHTFLAHEYGTCPDCGARVEGRAVLRSVDGTRFVNASTAHASKQQAVLLLRCPSCGPRERLLDEDGARWVEKFLAKADIPPGVKEVVFKTTTSTCPKCLALVEADVVITDGNQVFFQKTCKTCGPSRAMVSEDARYYVKAYTFARAGTEPLKFATKAEHGCPTDCGTCDEHEQHTCLPIIEVTDHCNLECPICIVNNQYSTHMEPAAFQRIIDRLVENEGVCESVAISGGEPTSHPKILELVDIATRDEIGRVVVITNGLRLGRDREFALALKAKGAYVGLQLDGFTADTHEKIRGRDLCKEKEAALRILEELDIPTQMIFVATRGVNEHQIGRAVNLFLEKDFIVSLNFQPAAYTGFGGGAFEGQDPLDKLTIPGVIKAIDQQTNGTLKYEDFFPLPCSHPQCVSLTYVLKLNDGTCVPFPRFVDFRTQGGLLRSSATLPATREVQDSLNDIVHDVFARQDEIPHGPEILKALRRSLDVMFPDRPVSQKEAVRIGERQAKSIFMHAYMDRYDFDLERLRKCCHHYPQVDGRIMPACGFNMFHRGAAVGPDSPKPKPRLAVINS